MNVIPIRSELLKRRVSIYNTVVDGVVLLVFTLRSLSICPSTGEMDSGLGSGPGKPVSVLVSGPVS